MATENLQTIIVSKDLAPTRSKAERIARRYANRIYTSRETSGSFRFRQRPPKDFKKKSFRSFPLPNEPGVVLVYGDLKRKGNPGKQMHLRWSGGTYEDQLMQEWDFWMLLCPKIRKINDVSGLRKAINIIEKKNLKSVLIRSYAVEAIADRARDLGVSRMPKNFAADERIYRLLKEGKYGNPQPIRKKSKRKSTKKKSPKPQILRSPSRMPDPGPCAWLGSVVEWAWIPKRGEKLAHIDDKGNAIWEPSSEWMFLWSPKYKAVVSVPCPRNMYRKAHVSRHGGAAKMFERFAARPAENTFEIEVPNIPIQEVGCRAAHIVYRSDKWSPSRKPSDYIHDFKATCNARACRSKNVKLYCGPSIERPEVFICFGGKLTLTERGLVF